VKQDFSPLWSPEERLLLVILLTSMIREDIHAGTYNTPGRPNIQSVHEVITAPAAVLNAMHEEIDAMVEAYGRDRLFAKSLPEYWNEDSRLVVS
jgi:hypothetical protein